MNMITEALRNFRRAPLVDLDTPHEPSAAPVLFPCAGSSADQSPRSGRPGVDGPAAPTSPGAAGIHPSQWPTDWDNIRRDLAHLRSVLTEALEWIDEIDPTAKGLARTTAVHSSVTVHNSHLCAITDITRQREQQAVPRR